MKNHILQKHSVSTTLCGKQLTISTGELATQATGAVLLQYGDTSILATATLGEGREGAGFFPLVVEYQEKYYAGGKVTSNRFNKREGRPSEQSILAGRVIDRPIRPLFPKGVTNELQIVLTILSADLETDPSTFGPLAASCALMVSGIPFDGPVGSVRIGLKEGNLILNPTYQAVEEGDLDLMVAGTKNAIAMVESEANEVDSDTMLKALEMAHAEIIKLCDLQIELKNKVNPEPKELTISEKVNPASTHITLDEAKIKAIKAPSKDEFKKSVKSYLKELCEANADKIEAEEFSKGDVHDLIMDAFEENMRETILEEGLRVDNRKCDEVRDLSSSVGLFERLHGSALFNRGETQVLSIVSLGSPTSPQIIETFDKEYDKTYIHHYNFPPFSVGEARPMRGPGRREIGHGYLAEKALIAVLPKKEEFNYTIRVVSEVLACNGSSSMASVCGSSMALMDAGVPIKDTVVGIAMGLVMDEETGRYKILSDIQGLEDFCGNMDFKVAKTKKGITALQMDIKLKGLPIELMREALTQAQKGLDEIRACMEGAIDSPRAEISKYAPIVRSFRINEDDIAAVIGKGGETIQNITKTTETEIGIEDDGLVVISAPNIDKFNEAKAMIDQVTYKPQIGDEFDGKVLRVENYGAFVEFMPGKSGLVHISKVSPDRIEDLSTVLTVGQALKVKIIGFDKQGRVDLSHKEFFKKD